MNALIRGNLKSVAPVSLLIATSDQYLERWVRPNEISRWKEPST
jgi:hypothetical protein